MRTFLQLMRADLRREITRRWFVVVLGAGVVGAVLAGAAAATQDGRARTDDFHAASASVLLLGGLVVALGLGITSFWRDIQSGHLGLVAAAGAPRAVVAVARVLSRVRLLGVALALWTAVLLAMGALIGRGFDGPLLVHALSQFETLALTLLAAAAASTVLGPWVAAIIGLMAHITTQATVNLGAAADAGRLGSANRLMRVSYNILPHSIVSPLSADMQNRNVGGPAVPQFEINNVPVPIQASSVGSVLWTLAWCGFLVWLCFVGLRRRNLN